MILKIVRMMSKTIKRLKKTYSQYRDCCALYLLFLELRTLKLFENNTSNWTDFPMSTCTSEIRKCLTEMSLTNFWKLQDEIREYEEPDEKQTTTNWQFYW